MRPTKFTFPSNKILLKTIKAVLLPQTVMTNTKKHTNIIEKSIHLSLCSESKNEQREKILYLKLNIY